MPFLLIFFISAWNHCCNVFVETDMNSSGKLHKVSKKNAENLDLIACLVIELRGSFILPVVLESSSWKRFKHIAFVIWYWGNTVGQRVGYKALSDLIFPTHYHINFFLNWFIHSICIIVYTAPSTKHDSFLEKLQTKSYMFLSITFFPFHFAITNTYVTIFILFLGFNLYCSVHHYSRDFIL